ncbi:PREDICTED: BBSome-interacting protein 1 [Nicrophorus vespilloides]|uniref:BBSome-interacting protein 1 n=1 Tax=Nicrophorus vespilloides TaxID=110193 RepID=A0ABM1MRA3_NICVS|nr:PREDICTED: BBSome-interacting protein 1 [Nicrophorus vespilloides]
MSGIGGGDLKPVLPKSGQLIIEDVDDLVLCKPRLIPLKSFTLEKLEKMQRDAYQTAEKLSNQEAKH